MKLILTRSCERERCGVFVGGERGGGLVVVILGEGGGGMGVCGWGWGFVGGVGEGWREGREGPEWGVGVRGGVHGDYWYCIGNTLSELVILVTAREWSQDYEWNVHYPIALKAGIAKDIADAIADGRRPLGMSADEEIVYDFTTELQKTNACPTQPSIEPSSVSARKVWWT